MSNWRNEPPNEAQLKVISSLVTTLDMKNVNVPKTMGECADMIRALKATVSANARALSMSGANVFLNGELVEDKEINTDYN
jgi:hypothetical protein